jgi:hypothetical protein
MAAILTIFNILSLCSFVCEIKIICNTDIIDAKMKNSQKSSYNIDSCIKETTFGGSGIKSKVLNGTMYVFVDIQFADGEMSISKLYTTPINLSQPNLSLDTSLIP